MFISNRIQQEEKSEKKYGIKGSVENLQAKIRQEISAGEDISECVSQPVICMHNGIYYAAVFLYSCSEEDMKNGYISRPFGWVLADLATGDVIQQYQCKEKDFSDAGFDKKYDFRLNGEHDTSKEYYYKTYGFFDYVRAGILATGKVLYDRYEQYMERILANVPADYQRFYLDLSIKI